MAGGARIPSSPSRPCRFHLDTRYLLPLLLGREPGEADGPNEHEVFDRVDRLCRAGHGTAVAASLIAVGEAFTKISSDPVRYRPQDPADLPSAKLNAMVQEHRLGVCWAGHEGHGGGRKVLELASRVLSVAPGVGVADGLIVACAIVCPTTRRLYTTEARLIQNADIRALGRRGGRDWAIAEAP